MGSKLPRLPRMFAAHRSSSRDAGQSVVPVDDPWAGEDEDWARDDAAVEGPAEVARFYRGLAVGVVAGVAFWGLLAILLVLLLG